MYSEKALKQSAEYFSKEVLVLASEPFPLDPNNWNKTDLQQTLSIGTRAPTNEFTGKLHN